MAVVLRGRRLPQVALGCVGGRVRISRLVMLSLLHPDDQSWLAGKSALMLACNKLKNL